MGRYNEAGLPDIEGSFESSGAFELFGSRANATGCFTGSSAIMTDVASATTTSNSTYKMTFIAKRSNIIYGKSNTVMPASVNIKMVIYLGQTSQV